MHSKILYNMDRSDSRPFMLVKKSIDRRKSNVVYTVVGTFQDYAAAERAQGEIRGDRRVDDGGNGSHVSEGDRTTRSV